MPSTRQARILQTHQVHYVQGLFAKDYFGDHGVWANAEPFKEFEMVGTASKKYFIHIYVSAVRVQPHVAQTKSNRDGRPPKPFIGGRLPCNVQGLLANNDTQRP